MFKICYAKGVVKDLKKISPDQLVSIKEGIEDLETFPNISQIKRLKNHFVAEYRLRIGNYRILNKVQTPSVRKVVRFYDRPICLPLQSISPCITVCNTEEKYMITLRLDRDLEHLIEITAENLGLTKSELIRRSITDYIGRLKPRNAWDDGHDLFGKHASGRDDLSARRKELVKDKIRAKRK